MDVKALAAKLEISEREGPPRRSSCQSTCAARVVTWHPWLLADHYEFAIIEDASHAIGGRYLGESVGCCSGNNITVFSFHPVKIITTGKGVSYDQ